MMMMRSSLTISHKFYDTKFRNNHHQPITLAKTHHIPFISHLIVHTDPIHSRHSIHSAQPPTLHPNIITNTNCENINNLSFQPFLNTKPYHPSNSSFTQEHTSKSVFNNRPTNQRGYTFNRPNNFISTLPPEPHTISYAIPIRSPLAWRTTNVNRLECAIPARSRSS